MIDDVIRAEFLHPFLRFGARGGGDDGQAGQLAQLDRNRANAAGSADDQQRLPSIRSRTIDAHPIGQRFPRRDCRQRHGGRLGEGA